MREEEATRFARRHPMVGDMRHTGCPNHINGVRINRTLSEDVRDGSVKAIAWGLCRRNDRVRSLTRELVHIDGAVVERMIY